MVRDTETLSYQCGFKILSVKLGFVCPRIFSFPTQTREVLAKLIASLGEEKDKKIFSLEAISSDSNKADGKTKLVHVTW